MFLNKHSHFSSAVMLADIRDIKADIPATLPLAAVR
jgi:hypothetical protein